MSSDHHAQALAAVEGDDDGKAPYILTWTEMKLLGIAGVSSPIPTR